MYPSLRLDSLQMLFENVEREKIVWGQKERKKDRQTERHEQFIELLRN